MICQIRYDVNEIPDNCFSCPSISRRLEFVSNELSEYFFCRAKLRKSIDFPSVRPSWCPLIEIDDKLGE